MFRFFVVLTLALTIYYRHHIECCRLGLNVVYRRHNSIYRIVGKFFSHHIQTNLIILQSVVL